MLQVARLSPRLLGDSRDLVTRFILSQLHPDGGFFNRIGQRDLYYTVFGMESLTALRADLPARPIADYLTSFGDGGSLDFVHLACLARCWADLPRELSEIAPRGNILHRLEHYRSADGGYNAAPGSENGTVYGCLLGFGAYQDLRSEQPQAERMLGCLARLRAADGGYANQHDAPMGMTPATAAAVTLLRQLNQEPDPAPGSWLLSRCHPEGGFFASPAAPLPDLLSTATALHALAGMHVSLDGIREPCLDFIDTLWTNRGGFYGTWNDDTVDCEYTYYALLALGHLSL